MVILNNFDTNMESKTVYMLFTQGFNSNNFGITVIRKIIQLFTNSKYDHVELLMQGNTGFGLKYNNKLLPECQAFLNDKQYYSSSFTTKGHKLITFKARLQQLVDQKYTGKLWIIPVTVDKDLFWQDQKKVYLSNEKYTFVGAFISALDNKLKNIGINADKMFEFFKINLGKIYTKKTFCSAMVSINFQASAINKKCKRFYKKIDKNHAMLSSPEDIAKEVQEKTQNKIEFFAELKNGVIINTNPTFDINFLP